MDWFTRLLQDRKEKPQTLTERLQTLRKQRTKVEANDKSMPWKNLAIHIKRVKEFSTTEEQFSF